MVSTMSTLDQQHVKNMQQAQFYSMMGQFVLLIHILHRETICPTRDRRVGQCLHTLYVYLNEAVSSHSSSLRANGRTRSGWTPTPSYLVIRFPIPYSSRFRALIFGISRTFSRNLAEDFACSCALHCKCTPCECLVREQLGSRYFCVCLDNGGNTPTRRCPSVGIVNTLDE